MADSKDASANKDPSTTDMKAELFDLLRADAESRLSDHWAPCWSAHQKRWDRQKGMKVMTEKIKLLYLDTSLKAEEDIASAAERVEEAEMSMKALRGKDMPQEDEVKNAVVCLMKARRDLMEKRNVWETERDVMKHILDILRDEQHGWPNFPETNQAA